MCLFGKLKRYRRIATRYEKKASHFKVFRGSKMDKPKAWVDAATARAHVSTDRFIKASKSKRP